jgi:hypothetical protein
MQFDSVIPTSDGTVSILLPNLRSMSLHSEMLLRGNEKGPQRRMRRRAHAKWITKVQPDARRRGDRRHKKPCIRKTAETGA